MADEASIIDCRIVSRAVDAGAVLSRAGDGGSGAVVSFVGTARSTSSSRPGVRVVRLEYEAYEPMALAELERIAHEVVEQFGARRVLVTHRVGRLEIGEAAVVIVVVTPHRAAAFDGCRYIIEELKQRVPIWKKEVFEDGAEWVNARP